MLVEIYLSKPVEPLGDCARFYYETDNKYFIDEVKKYICPFRLALFLDEAKKQFEDIKELVKLKEEQRADLFIDLSLASQNIINDPNLFGFSDKYLEQTKHLNQYGYELELTDLTEKSDRRYEMELDSSLYRN
jgi:hypothetical protein